jgi:hypothetical protein
MMADFTTYLDIMLILIIVTIIFVLVYQIFGEEEKVGDWII